MSTRDLARAKDVLLYLREMIERCRLRHRPDLVDYYTDGWEMASDAIYGPLPERAASRGYYAQPTQKHTSEAPPWKQQMLAKPFRKIVARLSVVEDGITFDYEQLECGHRFPAGIDPPDSPQAKRRRCNECARLAKKSVESEGAAPSRKGATA